MVIFSKILSGLLIFISLDAAISQTTERNFTTLQADFRTNDLEDSKAEECKGSVFISADQHMWIRVVEPLIQYMNISQNEMKIYYPDQNTAFIIRSLNSFSYLFITPFITALRKDYYLADLKYVLQSFYSKNDTLISTWIPPNELKEKLLSFTIYSCNDRIQEVVTNDFKGRANKTILFSDYELVDSLFWFPFSVSIVQTNGDALIKKHTYLSNVAVDAALPDSIIGFKIPENAKVKEYEW